MNYEKKLLQQFRYISDLGYVRSLYNGRGCIGRTFEYLLGLDGDSSEDPDYHGIEIKTKTHSRNSHKRYITLFSCVPDSQKNVITNLCNKYGKINVQTGLTEFYISLYTGWKKKINEKNDIKLCLDLERKKLYLFIYENEKLIDKSIFWNLEYIKIKLLHKLQKVCYVKAEEKKIQTLSFFHYNEIHFYMLKSFREFLYLLEHGKIRITFKIGRYKNGPKKGNIYDHGISFDLCEDFLNYLFKEYRP